jgi:hypothetical protein
MEKDYRLLRPFDLETAKRGEKICLSNGNEFNQLIKIVGSTFDGEFIFMDALGSMFGKPVSELRISPLAWLEGRPVYKGHVLYNTCFECDVVITGEYDAEGYIGTNRVDVSPPYKKGNSGINTLTWQKPKTKREGWVNLSTRYTVSNPYDTKEEADYGVNESMRIACIHITWEE